MRPGAEAPFECPLTGGPLNGRSRTLLHKPTGLVFTESGLTKAPGVARELLLEAARSRLAADDGPPAEQKKGKKKATAAAARARLEALVERGGKWESSEMLVINPEGDDAEAAKGRMHAIQTKVRAFRLSSALRTGWPCPVVRQMCYQLWLCNSAAVLAAAPALLCRCTQFSVGLSLYCYCTCALVCCWRVARARSG